jgi:argininosuccinate lyase
MRERFGRPADPFNQRFVASVEDDAKLARHDLAGSRAHAKMLRKVGLLRPAELQKILRALDQIERDLAAGRRRLDVAREDVHMNVENWLTELAGAAGARIHAARSRNDQVALDLRLYVREQIENLDRALATLCGTLVSKASAHRDWIAPGYTHLQRAQPIVFAHALLAFHDMMARDRARLADALKRVEVSPLGAGAMAGTSLPIDPASTARELGFGAVFSNSLDAVGDRDFAVEFVAATALLMTHLSQIAENLVLWSTAEFGFVELPDALCTTSSIMPQKKNPDMVELVRGKAGRVAGNLVDLLMTLKALPLGYNRDLQESKPPVFEAAETALASTHAITLAVGRMKVKRRALRAAASDPGLLATDLAEHLVRKGVPFREAHGIVARFVRDRAKLSSLVKYSPAFADLRARELTPEKSVRSRTSAGGAGVDPVRRRLAELSRSGRKGGRRGR